MENEEDVERARAMLNAMPDEVFDEWIAPLVRLEGWPFQSLTSFATGYWFQNLNFHTLKEISEIRWHRRKIPITLGRFDPDSQQIILWMVSEHLAMLKGLPAHTPLKNIKHGTSRACFSRALDFIKDHAAVYSSVVLIDGEGGYEVMDGNHRVAACFLAGLPDTFRLDAWVGEESDSDH